MLGGYAHISTEDIRGSKELLRDLFNGKYGEKLGKTKALGTKSHSISISEDPFIRRLILSSYESTT